MLQAKSLQAFALIILIFCFSAVAQLQPTESATASASEKEKAKLELEKKGFLLAEKIASDAANLKVAENRAFVYAAAADLLWAQDQKRARTLFRSAADELVAANAETEAKRATDDDAFNGFGNDFTSPRRSILQKVAKHDPDLALELLQQTRTAKLAAEMAKANAPADPNVKADKEEVSFGFNNSKWLVQEEIRLEQSFATQAAEKDPKRAAKLIRDSMAKNGVSYEAMGLVRKLHTKDAELANSLFAEIAQKLIDSDLSGQMSQSRNTAIGLLREYSKPADVKAADAKKQPLKLDDKILRDLALKVADTLQKSNNFTSLWEFYQTVPILEKIAPDRAAALKQKQAALEKNAPEGMSGAKFFSMASDPNATPESLITDAGKMPAGMGLRGQMYQRATNKLLEKNEFDRARQLLKDTPPSKERDDALAMVDSRQAENAAKEGKFDEARKLIGGIGKKSTQINQLIKLALAFHAKGGKENQETAAGIMDEAKRMVDTSPQTNEEVTDLMSVIAGYAVVEPNQAFQMLSPLVDQVNDLAQASALLAKYQKRQFMFRDGEMLMTAGLSQMRGSIGFVKDLGKLAASDFERTRGLTERFQRSDVRLLSQILLAQSILQEDPGVFDREFRMATFID